MELIKNYTFPAWYAKKEYLHIFLSLLLFLTFSWLAHYWDITSVPIDPDILSTVIMAILSLFLFKAITWLIIKALWPVMANYSRNHFNSNFNSLPASYKVIIFLSFYLLLLYAFVLSLVALA